MTQQTARWLPEPRPDLSEALGRLHKKPIEYFQSDPNVLEVLTHNGLTVAPDAGTAKMRIGVPAVQATSPAEASAKAVERVREFVPATGYTLSEPEPANPDSGPPPL